MKTTLIALAGEIRKSLLTAWTYAGRLAPGTIWSMGCRLLLICVPPC